jgi:hypothetical protein
VDSGSKIFSQAPPGDLDDGKDLFFCQGSAHFIQRYMGGNQSHSQPLAGKHHDEILGSRKASKEFGMPLKRNSGSSDRPLADRTSGDSLDLPVFLQEGGRTVS